MSEKMGVCTIVPRDQKGFRPQVFGMGILVNNGREIVTCAHVIDMALGPGWQELKEQAVVRICFPFVAGFPCLEGTVDEKRSIPPGRTSGGEPSDVAVIQLTQDAPDSAERAVLTNHAMNASAQAYGFRGKEIDGVWKSHPDGEWSDGKILGAQPAGRAQFDGLRDISAPVERGFSGAGVYDPNLNAVVGMIVESDKDYKHIAQFIDVSSLKKVIGEQAADAIPPPHLKQLDPVVDDLTTEDLVLVLGPGVNPETYINLAEALVQLVAGPRIPTEQKEEEQKQKKEKEEAEKKFLKEYFGSPCLICYYLPSLRPPGCPLIAGFPSLNTPLPDHLFYEQKLSVAKTICRSLSQFYEIENSTISLYSQVNRTRIFDKHAHGNKSYHRLAQLARDWWVLTHRSPFSLIVTTCIDTGLEEQFEKEFRTLEEFKDPKKPIPIDLVWYVAADTDDDGGYGYYKYRAHATGDEIRVARNDNAMKGGSAPITILKLFGTSSDPYLITQDQVSYFLSDLPDPVPRDLLAMLQKKNVLFLGFSPNDADLRAVVQRLYPEKRIKRRSLLLHRSIAGKLDEAIWSSYGGAHHRAKLAQIDRSLEDVIADICDTSLERKKAELQNYKGG